VVCGWGRGGGGWGLVAGGGGLGCGDFSHSSRPALGPTQLLFNSGVMSWSLVLEVPVTHWIGHWVSQMTLVLWRKKKFLALDENRCPIPWLSTP